MSPKPVDVRRALETLRQERPSPEAAGRVRVALASLPGERSSRRSLARPLTAMLIAAALALVVLTPRTHAGSAWAQTLANTFEAPASYAVNRWPNGRIGFEEWREGRKRAHVLYDRAGKPSMEWREDGKRLYNYAGDMFSGPATNARLWGMVSKSADRATIDETPYGSPQNLLRQSGVEVVSHKEAADGRPETYRLWVPRPWLKGQKEEMVAEIDPVGHRIARLGYLNRDGFLSIEYPPSIPPAVFEPRPHAVPNVDVYDLNAQTRTVQRTLRKGLGKQGPVTLRLVALDGEGTLWAFWTGALPDARLTRKVRIPGVAATGYATKKAFTSDWKPNPYARLVPNATGTRLGGMSLVPKAPLGRTVDLDVPYPGGTARFRRVPILRIGLYNHIEALLGVETVYPAPSKKPSASR